MEEADKDRAFLLDEVASLEAVREEVQTWARKAQVNENEKDALLSSMIPHSVDAANHAMALGDVLSVWADERMHLRNRLEIAIELVRMLSAECRMVGEESWFFYLRDRYPNEVLQIGYDNEGNVNIFNSGVAPYDEHSKLISSSPSIYHSPHQQIDSDSQVYNNTNQISFRKSTSWGLKRIMERDINIQNQQQHLKGIESPLRMSSSPNRRPILKPFIINPNKRSSSLSANNNNNNNNNKLLSKDKETLANRYIKSKILLKSPIRITNVDPEDFVQPNNHLQSPSLLPRAFASRAASPVASPLRSIFSPPNERARSRVISGSSLANTAWHRADSKLDEWVKVTGCDADTDLTSIFDAHVHDAEDVGIFMRSLRVASCTAVEDAMTMRDRLAKLLAVTLRACYRAADIRALSLKAEVFHLLSINGCRSLVDKTKMMSAIEGGVDLLIRSCNTVNRRLLRTFLSLIRSNASALFERKTNTAKLRNMCHAIHRIQERHAFSHLRSGLFKNIKAISIRAKFKAATKTVQINIIRQKMHKHRLVWLVQKLKEIFQRAKLDAFLRFQARIGTNYSRMRDTDVAQLELFSVRARGLDLIAKFWSELAREKKRTVFIILKKYCDFHYKVTEGAKKIKHLFSTVRKRHLRESLRKWSILRANESCKDKIFDIKAEIRVHRLVNALKALEARNTKDDIAQLMLRFWTTKHKKQDIKTDRIRAASVAFRSILHTAITRKQLYFLSICKRLTMRNSVKQLKSELQTSENQAKANKFASALSRAWRAFYIRSTALFFEEAHQLIKKMKNLISVLRIVQRIQHRHRIHSGACLFAALRAQRIRKLHVIDVERITSNQIQLRAASNLCIALNKPQIRILTDSIKEFKYVHGRTKALEKFHRIGCYLLRKIFLHNRSKVCQSAFNMIKKRSYDKKQISQQIEQENQRKNDFELKIEHAEQVFDRRRNTIYCITAFNFWRSFVLKKLRFRRVIDHIESILKSNKLINLKSTFSHLSLFSLSEKKLEQVHQQHYLDAQQVRAKNAELFFNKSNKKQLTQIFRAWQMSINQRRNAANFIANWSIKVHQRNAIRSLFHFKQQSFKSIRADLHQRSLMTRKAHAITCLKSSLACGLGLEFADQQALLGRAFAAIRLFQKYIQSTRQASQRIMRWIKHLVILKSEKMGFDGLKERLICSRSKIESRNLKIMQAVLRTERIRVNMVKMRYRWGLSKIGGAKMSNRLLCALIQRVISTFAAYRKREQQHAFNTLFSYSKKQSDLINAKKVLSSRRTNSLLTLLSSYETQLSLKEQIVTELCFNAWKNDYLSIKKHKSSTYKLFRALNIVSRSELRDGFRRLQNNTSKSVSFTSANSLNAIIRNPSILGIILQSVETWVSSVPQLSLKSKYCLPMLRAWYTHVVTVKSQRSRLRGFSNVIGVKVQQEMKNAMLVWSLFANQRKFFKTKEREISQQKERVIKFATNLMQHAETESNRALLVSVFNAWRLSSPLSVSQRRSGASQILSLFTNQAQKAFSQWNQFALHERSRLALANQETSHLETRVEVMFKSAQRKQLQTLITSILSRWKDFVESRLVQKSKLNSAVCRIEERMINHASFAVLKLVNFSAYQQAIENGKIRNIRQKLQSPNINTLMISIILSQLANSLNMLHSTEGMTRIEVLLKHRRASSPSPGSSNRNVCLANPSGLLTLILRSWRSAASKERTSTLRMSRFISAATAVVAASRLRLMHETFTCLMRHSNEVQLSLINTTAKARHHDLAIAQLRRIVQRNDREFSRNTLRTLLHAWNEYATTNATFRNNISNVLVPILSRMRASAERRLISLSLSVWGMHDRHQAVFDARTAALVGVLSKDETIERFAEHERSRQEKNLMHTVVAGWRSFVSDERRRRLALWRVSNAFDRAQMRSATEFLRELSERRTAKISAALEASMITLLSANSLLVATANLPARMQLTLALHSVYFPQTIRAQAHAAFQKKFYEFLGPYLPDEGEGIRTPSRSSLSVAASFAGSGSATNSPAKKKQDLLSSAERCPVMHQMNLHDHAGDTASPRSKLQLSLSRADARLRQPSSSMTPAYFVEEAADTYTDMETLQDHAVRLASMPRSNWSRSQSPLFKGTFKGDTFGATLTSKLAYGIDAETEVLANALNMSPSTALRVQSDGFGYQGWRSPTVRWRDALGYPDIDDKDTTANRRKLPFTRDVSFIDDNSDEHLDLSNPAVKSEIIRSISDVKRSPIFYLPPSLLHASPMLLDSLRSNHRSEPPISALRGLLFSSWKAFTAESRRQNEVVVRLIGILKKIEARWLLDSVQCWSDFASTSVVVEQSMLVKQKMSWTAHKKIERMITAHRGPTKLLETAFTAWSMYLSERRQIRAAVSHLAFVCNSNIRVHAAAALVRWSFNTSNEIAKERSHKPLSLPQLRTLAGAVSILSHGESGLTHTFLKLILGSWKRWAKLQSTAQVRSQGLINALIRSERNAARRCLRVWSMNSKLKSAGVESQAIRVSRFSHVLSRTCQRRWAQGRVDCFGIWKNLMFERRTKNERYTLLAKSLVLLRTHVLQRHVNQSFSVFNDYNHLCIKYERSLLATLSEPDRQIPFVYSILGAKGHVVLLRQILSNWRETAQHQGFIRQGTVHLEKGVGKARSRLMAASLDRMRVNSYHEQQLASLKFARNTAAVAILSKNLRERDQEETHYWFMRTFGAWKTLSSKKQKVCIALSRMSICLTKLQRTLLKESMSNLFTVCRATRFQKALQALQSQLLQENRLKRYISFALGLKQSRLYNSSLESFFKAFNKAKLAQTAKDHYLDHISIAGGRLERFLPIPSLRRGFSGLQAHARKISKLNALASNFNHEQNETSRLIHQSFGKWRRHFLSRMLDKTRSAAMMVSERISNPAPYVGIPRILRHDAVHVMRTFAAWKQLAQTRNAVRSTVLKVVGADIDVPEQSEIMRQVPKPSRLRGRTLMGVAFDSWRTLALRSRLHKALCLKTLAFLTTTESRRKRWAFAGIMQSSLSRTILVSKALAASSQLRHAVARRAACVLLVRSLLRISCPIKLPHTDELLQRSLHKHSHALMIRSQRVNYFSGDKSALNVVHDENLTRTSTGFMLGLRQSRNVIEQHGENTSNYDNERIAGPIELSAFSSPLRVTREIQNSVCHPILLHSEVSPVRHHAQNQNSLHTVRMVPQSHIAQAGFSPERIAAIDPLRISQFAPKPVPSSISPRDVPFHSRLVYHRAGLDFHLGICLCVWKSFISLKKSQDLAVDVQARVSQTAWKRAQMLQRLDHLCNVKERHLMFMGILQLRKNSTVIERRNISTQRIVDILEKSLMKLKKRTINELHSHLQKRWNCRLELRRILLSYSFRNTWSALRTSILFAKGHRDINAVQMRRKFCSKKGASVMAVAFSRIVAIRCLLPGFYSLRHNEMNVSLQEDMLRAHGASLKSLNAIFEREKRIEAVIHFQRLKFIMAFIGIAVQARFRSLLSSFTTLKTELHSTPRLERALKLSSLQYTSPPQRRASMRNSWKEESNTVLPVSPPSPSQIRDAAAQRVNRGSTSPLRTSIIRPHHAAVSVASPDVPRLSSTTSPPASKFIPPPRRYSPSHRIDTASSLVEEASPAGYARRVSVPNSASTIMQPHFVVPRPSSSLGGWNAISHDSLFSGDRFAAAHVPQVTLDKPPPVLSPASVSVGDNVAERERSHHYPVLHEGTGSPTNHAVRAVRSDSPTGRRSSIWKTSPVAALKANNNNNNTSIYSPQRPDNNRQNLMFNGNPSPGEESRQVHSSTNAANNNKSSLRDILSPSLDDSANFVGSKFGPALLLSPRTFNRDSFGSIVTQTALPLDSIGRLFVNSINAVLRTQRSRAFVHWKLQIKKINEAATLDSAIRTASDSFHERQLRTRRELSRLLDSIQSASDLAHQQEQAAKSLASRARRAASTISKATTDIKYISDTENRQQKIISSKNETLSPFNHLHSLNNQRPALKSPQSRFDHNSNDNHSTSDDNGGIAGRAAFVEPLWNHTASPRIDHSSRRIPMATPRILDGVSFENVRNYLSGANHAGGPQSVSPNNANNQEFPQLNREGYLRRQDEGGRNEQRNFSFSGNNKL